MAIATASEYKVWAGISGSTYDSVIAVVIAGVQKEMEDYCGRLFDYSDDREDYLDGTGTNLLVLKNAPLYTEVVTVKVVAVDDSILYTYPSSTYNVDTANGIITLGNTFVDAAVYDTDGAYPVWARNNTTPCFPAGRRNIVVSYKAGYGTPNTAMPDSLKLALYKLVDMQMAMRGKDTSLASENLGQYSYTRAAGAGGNLGDYQKMLASLMAPWRRLGVVA